MLAGGGNYFGVGIAAVGAGIGTHAVLAAGGLRGHLGGVSVGQSGNRLRLGAPAHGAGEGLDAFHAAAGFLGHLALVIGMLAGRGNFLSIGIAAVGAGVGAHAVLGAGGFRGHLGRVAVRQGGNRLRLGGVAHGAGECLHARHAAAGRLGHLALVILMTVRSDGGGIGRMADFACEDLCTIFGTGGFLGDFTLIPRMLVGLVDCLGIGRVADAASIQHDAIFRAGCFLGDRAIVIAMAFCRKGFGVGIAAERAGVGLYAGFLTGRRLGDLAGILVITGGLGHHDGPAARKAHGHAITSRIARVCAAEADGIVSGRCRALDLQRHRADGARNRRAVVATVSREAALDIIWSRTALSPGEARAHKLEHRRIRIQLGCDADCVVGIAGNAHCDRNRIARLVIRQCCTCQAQRQQAQQHREYFLH